MKDKEEKKKKRFWFFGRKKAEEETEVKGEEEITETEETEEEAVPFVEPEPELEPVDYYEFMETTSKKMEIHKARVAGSWGEKRAARMIRDDSNALLGIPSRLEPFYSREFKGRPCFIVLGVLYAVCYALFCLSFASNGAFGIVLSLISVVGIILSWLFLFLLYVGYPSVQKLLVKKVSYNVLSTIEPKEECNRNLIISSNYDSQYGNHFKISDKFRFWIIACSMFSILFFIVFNLLRIFLGAGNTTVIAVLIAVSAIICVPSILVLILTFSLSKNKVEENNGFSTAVAMTVARYLIDEKKIPSDMRVSVVSFGGENAGHDGANAFVKRHADTDMFKNATMINIGDIVERKYFVATVDPVHKHTFGEKLVDIAKEVAEAQGIELTSEGKNFGVLTGYAATAFDKAGVDSLTISARDRNPFREITEENEEISDVVKDIFKLTVQIVEKISEE